MSCLRLQHHVSLGAGVRVRAWFAGSDQKDADGNLTLRCNNSAQTDLLLWHKMCLAYMS